MRRRTKGVDRNNSAIGTVRGTPVKGGLALEGA